MGQLSLRSLRRIIVKLGSSLLVDPSGRFSHASVAKVARDVDWLTRAGHEVFIVSSGAVSIGCHRLGIDRERARLDELQAAAATGQARLVQAWQEALSVYDLLAAQVLLTPEDTEHRRRFLNAKGTLLKLMESRVIPVINENDTVATDELRYGDNDRLAARVAQMVMADGLVLLSDVDGLFATDPRTDSNAELIASVRSITDDVMAMAGDAGSRFGTGGMTTKLQAARIARRAGCVTVIANGHRERPIHALESGGACTVIEADLTPAAARKQWLAGMLELKGALRIDHGAEQAIASGSSLLPVGLIEVAGDFRRGDPVAVVCADGRELGHGLVEYTSEDARAIVGARSDEIARRLGYRGRSVIVHRDDFVLFSDEN